MFRWINQNHRLIKTALVLSCLCAGPAGAAPSGRGGSLLPTGYLSTNGGQIVDSGGNPVRIDSIGWPGTDGPAGSALHGLWTASYKTILDSIKADGFNTVRIPWSNADLNTVPANTPQLGTIDYTKNSDLVNLTTLQIFQKIATYCGTIGLKLIFDHHTDDGGGGQQPNGLWIDSGPGTDGTDGAGHTGTVTAAKFQQDWVQFANAFSGNSTVIGYDLDNEPTSVGNINWGQGGAVDILAMFDTVGNAIQGVNSGPLIICEGPQYYSPPPAGRGMDTTVAAPEGDLTAAGSNPVVLNTAHKVVYSVHEYPNEIAAFLPDSGSGFITRMNNVWGYLVATNIAPVWIGEMGSSMTSTDSQGWASTLLAYMNGQDGSQGGPTFSGSQQHVSGSWWLAGNESDNPDGIQTAWGVGNYRPEQQVITDQMLYIPSVSTPPAPGGLTATAGNAQVSLTWNASTGATSYNVSRSTTNGSGYGSVATGIGATSYTNTGLTNGTTYYFVVSATNASGTSGNSAQASATPASSPWDPTAWYSFICHTGGLAADSNNSTTSGTGIIQNTYNSGYWTQQWQIKSDSGGYYHLINRNSGMALDCNGSTSAGSNLVQKTYNAGAWDQQWQIVNNGGGYYHLVCHTSSLAADCNGSTSIGTNLVQKANNAGYWDQQWQILKH